MFGVSMCPEPMELNRENEALSKDCETPSVRTKVMKSAEQNRKYTREKCMECNGCKGNYQHLKKSYQASWGQTPTIKSCREERVTEKRCSSSSGRKHSKKTADYDDDSDPQIDNGQCKLQKARCYRCGRRKTKQNGECCGEKSSRSNQASKERSYEHYYESRISDVSSKNLQEKSIFSWNSALPEPRSGCVWIRQSSLLLPYEWEDDCEMIDWVIDQYLQENNCISAYYKGKIILTLKDALGITSTATDLEDLPKILQGHVFETSIPVIPEMFCSEMLLVDRQSPEEQCRRDSLEVRSSDPPLPGEAPAELVHILPETGQSDESQRESEEQCCQKNADKWQLECVERQCQDGMPSQCHDDMPAQCQDGMPSQCHDDMPAQCQDGMPSQCHDGMPSQCHDDMPSQCHDDMPTQCQDGMPSQCHDDMPSQCQVEDVSSILNECKVDTLNQCQNDMSGYCQDNKLSQCQDAIPRQCQDEMPSQFQGGIPSQCQDGITRPYWYCMPSQCQEDMLSQSHKDMPNQYQDNMISQCQDGITRLCRYGMPSQSHEDVPSQCQDYMPHQCQDYMPCQCQDFTPHQCQDLMPSQCQDLTPSQCQDLTPSQCQDLTPSQCQDLMPSQCQDYMPCQRQDYTPSQRQDYTPSQCQDLVPSQCQDLTPSQCQDVMPSQCQDFTPSQCQDLMPSQCQGDAAKQCHVNVPNHSQEDMDRQ